MGAAFYICGSHLSNLLLQILLNELFLWMPLQTCESVKAFFSRSVLKVFLAYKYSLNFLFWSLLWFQLYS